MCDNVGGTAREERWHIRQTPGIILSWFWALVGCYVSWFGMWGLFDVCFPGADNPMMDLQIHDMYLEIPAVFVGASIGGFLVMPYMESKWCAMLTMPTFYVGIAIPLVLFGLSETRYFVALSAMASFGGTWGGWSARARLRRKTHHASKSSAA